MLKPINIKNTHTKIKKYINKTPCSLMRQLSQQLGCNIYAKCENLQLTGSFKIRGALSKLLSLSEQQKQAGVVTASTGNHGAAVACGLELLNLNGVIFVPENASPTKINMIKSYNANIKSYGNDCGETERYAREYAEKNNMTYISPYNDIDVIKGQGTIAVEINEQLAKSRNPTIFVSIGGGGLISGIAAFMKQTNPNCKIIGCLPENSPVMHECIKAGKIINIPTQPTLSDATAGNIEPDAITFEFCQHYVDDYVLVSEQEIKQAMQTYLDTEHLLCEGSAGVAVAAIIKTAKQYQQQDCVAIICGANISLENLRDVIGS